MIDAIDELIEYRKPGGLSALLQRFHRFHRANPQVFDFLVQELRDVRDCGWKCASVHSLWEHARWVLSKQRVPGEQFEMDNKIAPYYARAIAVVHPEFNGFFEMRKSQANADLGTMLEAISKQKRPGYIRKLFWADGKAIEQGWQPTKQHEPKPVSRRERVRRHD